MKMIIREGDFSGRLKHGFTRTLMVAGFLIAVLSNGHAFSIILPRGGGTNSSPGYTPLASWSFHDFTNWTSDQGSSPISFSNLNYSWLGDGSSLVVDTNISVWLNYNVYEPGTGATNLVVNAPGSISFWYAPDWSSTNAGGEGPGGWTQLIDVGEWTTNASFGYWGLSIDPAGAHLWFVSQDGAGNTYTLSTPVSWTTNYFHFVALTYSSTNVSLYVDGELATNDPGGLSIWPNSEVLSNGVFFGSDTNGQMEAQGLFNDVATYNAPMDAGTIQQTFNQEFPYYLMNPNNTAMFKLSNANSSPSTDSTPDVITGLGDLQSLGETSDCVSGTNVNYVYITNITATAAADNTMNVTFTVEGGVSGYYYDVFVTGALESPLPNAVWFWMGQASNCGIYSVNIASDNAFIILGTPQDSDGDGFTDAYKSLILHTQLTNPTDNADGILNGWEYLLGLNPSDSNITDPTERANYGYTPADWLDGVTGIKSGTITPDSEGNVLSVSQ
jgi:hypothetical protein